MTEFIIIRNAFKSDVSKRVFDFLSVESLRNPTNKQGEMITEICDGVEFLKLIKIEDAKKEMNHGDYLYQVSGFDKELICISLP